MKNLILLLLIFLTSNTYRAQEKNNYLFLNNGITVYLPQNDGTFVKKDFNIKGGADNYIEENSSQVYKPTNNEELQNIFKKSITHTGSPEISIIKDFDNYRNKVYSVINKTNKIEIRFCFYGSRLLVDKESNFGSVPLNFANENLIIIPDANQISRPEYGLSYKIYENFHNTGVNLFLLGQKVYSFNNTSELLHKLFTNAEIKIAEKRFSNQYFPYLLKKTDKRIEGNGGFQFTYGVSDDLGKEIIPPIYDKIILSSDAILVKEKGLWYFYDFFGNKLQNKGYRKILPLTSILPIAPNGEITDRYTTDGLLIYSVLDKNEIKQVSSIYKGTKSDFVNSWASYAICGTMGIRSVSLVQIILDNNNIELHRRTNWFNTKYQGTNDFVFDKNFAQGSGLSDFFSTSNSISLNIENELGKVKFLNKKDSLATKFIWQKDKRLFYLLKVLKNNRESFLPVSFNCNDDKCDHIGIDVGRYWTPEVKEKNYFDKIETEESQILLLNFNGDYSDTFYLSKEDAFNGNLESYMYYKLYKDDKMGFYSPRSSHLEFVKIKYTFLKNLNNRFLQFEDDLGKKGFLSEDGEEFFDL